MAKDIGWQKAFDTGLDSVVIRHYEDGIKGGKVLDVTGFNEEFIKTGHVIIKSATDVYKPMPVSNGAYGSLPANHTYVGVSVTTTATDEPMVGIMTSGEVNDAAVPFSMTSIMSAFKAAVPTIRFDHD